MKPVILFICLFFSYFTLATTVPMEEVVFTDAEIENLPPLDEMVGIPVEAPEHLGGADADGINETQEEVEAEIQLAHGGKCRRHHGGHGCGGGNRNSDGIIIIITPQPIIKRSNICRKGIAYCYTPGILPVGTYCECNTIYGYYVFSGRISSD